MYQEYHYICRKKTMEMDFNNTVTYDDDEVQSSNAIHEPHILKSILVEMLHGHSPLAIGYHQYLLNIKRNKHYGNEEIDSVHFSQADF